MSFFKNYITSVLFEFNRYKSYGDKTLRQLSEEDIFWQSSENDNSIALIIKHLAGNMLSRWTNFLEEDGEKEWRNRDEEFEAPPATKNEVIELWEKGWHCLFEALGGINAENFESLIKIRGENHFYVLPFLRSF